MSASSEVEDEDEQSKSSSVGNLVKWLSDSLTGTDESKRYKVLLSKLSESTMFRHLSLSQREKLADLCVPMPFKKGQILQQQGLPQETAIIIVEGECTRLRSELYQVHVVGSLGGASSSATVGMLHLLSRAPSFATLKATTAGHCYLIQSKDLEQLMREDPLFSQSIVQSLCEEVVALNQASHTLNQTPLFMNQSKSLPWFAITCAASVESFYRSAMNAWINAQLTGTPRGRLFPNMHIQVPVRVLYINGFKGIRYFLDSNFSKFEQDLDHPQMVAAGLATLPGLIMTPISSVLEATNAGHMNSEPLTIRWTRGLIPRGLREVIFGVGINQLADFYEERIRISDPVFRNLGGSMLAGLVAGYLSHVPHSLSALKLLNPKVSYRDLFRNYTKQWDQRVPQDLRFRRVVVNSLACFFPKGCLVRSLQIGGSFVIINSAILALKHIKVDVYDARKAVLGARE